MIPEWLKEEDDRYGNVVPIELFYDDVRAKYGLAGNQKKLDALKVAAKKRKAAEMVSGAGAD